MTLLHKLLDLAHQESERQALRNIKAEEDRVYNLRGMLPRMSFADQELAEEMFATWKHKKALSDFDWQCVEELTRRYLRQHEEKHGVGAAE